MYTHTLLDNTTLRFKKFLISRISKSFFFFYSKFVSILIVAKRPLFIYLEKKSIIVSQNRVYMPSMTFGNALYHFSACHESSFTKKVVPSLTHFLFYNSPFHLLFFNLVFFLVFFRDVSKGDENS